MGEIAVSHCNPDKNMTRIGDWSRLAFQFIGDRAKYPVGRSPYVKADGFPWAVIGQIQYTSRFRTNQIRCKQMLTLPPKRTAFREIGRTTVRMLG